MRFNLSRPFDSWRPFDRSLSTMKGEARVAVPAVYARSEFAEQFRLLALNVISLIGDSAERSLAVFSANARDGRSMVAMNLSLALTAHSDVALVGYRGRSRVDKQLLDPFQVAEDEAALIPKNGASDELHRLWLVPSATSVAKAEQVASADGDTGSESKLLIVDAPAADQSAEAFLLAQRCHNVLYVMRKGVVDLEPHRRALDQLARLNTRVLGIVLNEN